MKYRVYWDEEIIGETDLEFKDEGMNVRLGKFVPGPAYEKVKHIFHLFIKANAANPVDEEIIGTYYQKRDELNLKVIGIDGKLLPTGAVHIENLWDELNSEVGQSVYQITIFPPERDDE